jgi:hypothetical protein
LHRGNIERERERERERESLREKVTSRIRAKPSSLNSIVGAPLLLDEIGTKEGLGRLGVWDLVGNGTAAVGSNLQGGIFSFRVRVRKKRGLYSKTKTT